MQRARIGKQHDLHASLRKYTINCLKEGLPKPVRSLVPSLSAWLHDRTRDFAPSEPAMDQNTYHRAFSGSKREKALSQALDIRKFEIEMYWKRATYFWSLIAATLAGYVAVQASKDIDEKHFLSLIISCLGLLFAFAWSCVNRGSKQWQENWENHVDMLEDDIQGPLYKTVLRRRPAETGKEKIFYALTGPAPYSVSGINQIISIYVVLLWLFLVGRSLGVLKTPLQISLGDGLIVVATLFSCLVFLVFGRTHLGNHGNVAKRRISRISVAD